MNTLVTYIKGNRKQKQSNAFRLFDTSQSSFNQQFPPSTSPNSKSPLLYILLYFYLIHFLTLFSMLFFILISHCSISLLFFTFQFLKPIFSFLFLVLISCSYLLYLSLVLISCSYLSGSWALGLLGF